MAGKATAFEDEAESREDAESQANPGDSATMDSGGPAARSQVWVFGRAFRMMSMERVLEPEYMDTTAEAESYAAMDHTEANRSVVDCFLAHGLQVGRVLDIGTGPADIPILLAATATRLTIIAIDAARRMLELARRHVAAAGLGGRIWLQQCDAKALPLEDRSCAGVISNTILHHIPDPVPYLAEANRVLADGGVLVIRDLHRPPNEEAAWRLVSRHAARATKTQRQLLFDSLRASLTLDEARAAARAAGMTDATVEMTSDRHYTIGIDRR